MPATNEMLKARFADRSAAAEAVAMVMPMIEAAMRRPEVGDSGFLYIVIMNPVAQPGADRFEDAILYEQAVGDREKWDADYAQYARGKARMSWRTGLDSHQVQEIAPHRVVQDDTTVWGSVCVDGIVVGVSGAQPWFDEAFAGAVAHAFKAITKARALAAAAI